MQPDIASVTWLLIDSCGAIATLVLGRGDKALVQAQIAGRNVSAEWPATLRKLLVEADLSVRNLDVVGTVSGPGSFTGVRVGLAMAKGLCEAANAKLITISRLEVVTAQATESSIAVMDAGRGDYYVRDDQIETLMNQTQLHELVQRARCLPIATMDEGLTSIIGPKRVVVVALSALSAVPILLARMRSSSFDDTATSDANYVRGESDIYTKKAVA